jgi:hypothetical protein
MERQKSILEHIQEARQINEDLSDLEFTTHYNQIGQSLDYIKQKGSVSQKSELKNAIEQELKTF